MLLLGVHPLEDAAPAVRVAHRARAAPGLGEAVPAVDVKAVFGWRDEVSEKDDTSQVDWIEGLDAKVVRGTGVVAEAGLVRVGDRELPTTT